MTHNLDYIRDRHFRAVNDKGTLAGFTQLAKGLSNPICIVHAGTTATVRTEGLAERKHRLHVRKLSPQRRQRVRRNASLSLAQEDLKRCRRQAKRTADENTVA